jgi:4-amino-4-deoxy-L-arabinose transferase-like glycosyltransferase
MSPSSTLSLRDGLLLVLACLALFLPGFASLPPVDRDEGRYIVSSERMAETGDFIDIRYQDQPRYLQPAGIYWLQALSARTFDPALDSAWAYRVPSLIGAIFAVLLTGWIAARLFGRSAGLIAGALLAACLSLNFEARIAKTDAVLLASIVTAHVALLRIYTEQNAQRWIAAVFWAALGVGLMIKGPIILAVTGATLAALVLWDRKFAWLVRVRPLWGPLIMLAIALPWYAAIGVHTEGAFFERALGQSMLDKVGNSQQGHAGPPGYHAALVMLMFWPGSLLLASAALTAWRRRGEPAVRFLACWAVPTWLIFELVATKLPHYVLPTYPALACLCALALNETRPRGTPETWALALWSVIWLAATALIAALGPAALYVYEQRMSAITIALSALTAIAAVLALIFFWRRESGKMIVALTLAGALGIGNIFGYSAPRLDTLWMSPRIDAMVRQGRPCQNSVLITVPYTEPSLVFLYGRTQTRLAASGAEAAHALSADAACAVALIGAEQQRDFAAAVAALGLAVSDIGQVSGRNYSNGDDLVLTLYRAQNAADAGD